MRVPAEAAHVVPRSWCRLGTDRSSHGRPARAVLAIVGTSSGSALRAWRACHRSMTRAAAAFVRCSSGCAFSLRKPFSERQAAEILPVALAAHAERCRRVSRRASR